MRARKRLPRPKGQLKGLVWYLGIPGSGKTSQAIVDCWQRTGNRGVPAIMLDPARVAAMRKVHHAGSVSELERRVYREGKHTAITPGSKDVAEAVFALVLKRGKCVLLVDESAEFLQASGSRVSALMLLMRRWRHLEVDVLLTTQHLSGDVSQAALSLNPTLCVFRTTAPRSLEVLERDFGLTKSKVLGLEQFEFVEVFQGWR